MFQAVENMCSHKMAAHLYSQLKVVCVAHVQSNLTQFTGYPFILYNKYILSQSSLSVYSKRLMDNDLPLSCNTCKVLSGLHETSAKLSNTRAVASGPNVVIHHD